MRQAAILTGPDTYLDHIGVICYLMDIPLFITEEKTYESACIFYPQIKTLKKDHSELSADFLAQNFEALFESGRFFAAELKPVFEVLYQKKMRFVFCPHGNSDKGRSFKNHVEQDISLVYGSHMIDLLTETGAKKQIKTLVSTGNYRLPFYRKYQSFYDELTQKYVFSKLDPLKKTILYAPTWQDGENPSSFFQDTQRLIEDLGKDFNLIIKLHPFLEEFHPAHTYKILSQYEHIQGVTFLTHFPAIYPLLAASDLYIGDYSSIGYDFLAFDKPLYFLGEKESHLRSCGLVVPSSEKIELFIQKTWEENQITKALDRKALYTYAFGEERPFSRIKQAILQALLT